MEFYDINVLDNEGIMVSLNEFRGKVLLIVNTATKCGFTPQYKGLEKLYEKYKDRGFEILDFPCNQFLNQAPGNDKEIHNFCILNFDTTFRRFSKIKVNGKETCELYKYLKEKSEPKKSRITWNFNKFLVSKDSNIILRFDSKIKPESLEKYIEEFLR